MDNIGISAKYVVTGIATYFVVFTKSWLPMYFVLGGILNSILSKVLKGIIRQPRPPDSLQKGNSTPCALFEDNMRTTRVQDMACPLHMLRPSLTLLRLLRLLYLLPAAVGRFPLSSAH